MLDELGLDAADPIAVVRTPPAVSLYHRFEHPLFARLLERLREQAQVVVLPRTPEQRAELAAAGGYVVPERAVDAQSLVAFCDVVVSAGGTMNREAVALGHARLDHVRGPPRRSRRAADRRGPAAPRSRVRRTSWWSSGRAGAASGERVRRDPELFTDLLVDGLVRR